MLAQAERYTRNSGWLTSSSLNCPKLPVDGFGAKFMSSHKVMDNLSAGLPGWSREVSMGGGGTRNFARRPRRWASGLARATGPSSQVVHKPEICSAFRGYGTPAPGTPTSATSMKPRLLCDCPVAAPAGIFAVAIKSVLRDSPPSTHATAHLSSAAETVSAT